MQRAIKENISAAATLAGWGLTYMVLCLAVALIAIGAIGLVAYLVTAAFS